MFYRARYPWGKKRKKKEKHSCINKTPYAIKCSAGIATDCTVIEVWNYYVKYQSKPK